MASERNEAERAEFSQSAGECLAGEDLYFVDEMGINIDMSRRYARAPKGERVVEEKPANIPENTSVVGALGAEGMVASMCVKGPVDGECFCQFIEQMLAPNLRPGQVVLMDNLNTHKSKRVEKAIEEAGASLIYLPPYSPDLNPIEECWSKVKTYLRSRAVREKSKLQAALKAAFATITHENIKGWFNHAGYNFSPNWKPL